MHWFRKIKQRIGIATSDSLTLHMEELRKRCLPGHCATFAVPKIEQCSQELSSFPDHMEVARLIDIRNRRAIAKADRITIGEKRNCFLALRLHEQCIQSSNVFLPLGITVGELVLSQVLATNSERERKA